MPTVASELTYEEFALDGVTYSAADQARIFDEFIDQDPYLSQRRGQVAERNGAVRPWVHRFDLRILQDM